jgi:adenylosuccinate lyase
VVFPDTTTILDYAMNRLSNILKDLQVYPRKMEANLKKTEAFLASEKIMLALVETGLDRQVAYGMVQRNALDAWVNGKDFRALIEGDKDITARLKKADLAKAFDTTSHFRHVKTLFKRVGL